MMHSDIGPQLGGVDVRGWLTFEWLSDDVQRREDSTANADYERGRAKFGRMFDRPATDTERMLLQHLEYELPVTLTTRVSFPASGVRKRSWPQLEDTAS